MSIRIGDEATQTAAYIAGISGATSAGGTAVFYGDANELVARADTAVPGSVLRSKYASAELCRKLLSSVESHLQ